MASEYLSSGDDDDGAPTAGSETEPEGSTDTSEHAFSYSKRLYDNVVSWYKTAEIKAQIILSLDGLFISFIVGSIFVKSSDAREILAVFGVETWVFVALMALCLAGSIISAITCLVSRVMTNGEVRTRYGKFVGPTPGPEYPSEVMWFFQAISQLDESAYVQHAGTITLVREQRALANQVYLLSGKVLRKLIWANYGFMFAGITFLLFLAAGVSYVVRLDGVL